MYNFEFRSVEGGVVCDLVDQFDETVHTTKICRSNSQAKNQAENWMRISKKRRRNRDSIKFWIHDDE